ncbi:MAG TPA: VIT1/CCC1 transporter family protein, partial [Ilumatobacteraceae bacterium]|nr:VIT1/CCC1 transporter family protein [Ilumatobacteraceae bacterium]
ARPVQAAWTSAASFAVGAAIPVLAAAWVGESLRIAAVMVLSVLALVVLGFVGARVGGAHPGRPVARVVIGGAIAMAVTMVVGALVGTAV